MQDYVDILTAESFAKLSRRYLLFIVTYLTKNCEFMFKCSMFGVYCFDVYSLNN